MDPSSVVHRLKALAAFSSIGLIALFVLGAGPRQGGVPPQPYGANFFSNTVLELNPLTKNWWAGS